MQNVTVAVIGLGYIGLPTSAALATVGVRVKGVDINEHYVAEVNAGRVPIVEPDLDTAVAGVVARGLLSASTEVEAADAYLIAVPTPFTGDHEPDVSYIRSAVESIAPHVKSGDVVILESTSPPGTTLAISQWLSDLRPDLRFPDRHSDPQVHVAHCPERVLPGRIMIEMITNDRVVGGLTPACAERAADIYRLFCEGEIVLTDASSAEMAKLTENSFRDVNIAFANELASVCEQVGVDVWEVIRLANHHPRVNVLNPGPGVGGHCIAVDPWFIVAAAPEHAQLIRRAREINDARPDQIVQQVADLVSQDSPTIACLGLAFKANIDDLRESPALDITERLAARYPSGRILAVEPHIHELPGTLSTRGNVTLAEVDAAISEADVVVLLVDHADFRAIDPTRLVDTKVVDTRGMWRA
jgi:UDP-N-acetyl-D-mannosaminuronic acid dehydrogenase